MKKPVRCPDDRHEVPCELPCEGCEEDCTPAAKPKKKSSKKAAKALPLVDAAASMKVVLEALSHGTSKQEDIPSVLTGRKFN